MPGKFAFKRSGAHRLACTSLYKRLLATCNRLKPTTASSSPLASQLQTLVRYRYRLDRKLQSPQQICDSLDFGRKALELLLAASGGSSVALTRLTQVLSRCDSMIETKSQAQNTSDVTVKRGFMTLSKKQTFLQIANDPATHICNPNSVPILDRPVDLTRIKGGKRFVPHYVVTQGIPFLRYGSEQPYGLSLNIRDQIDKGLKMRNYLEEMQYMIEVGNLEDEWDRQMDDLGAQEDDVLDRKRSWAQVYQEARKATSTRISTREDKLLAHAKRLWNIKLQEQTLAAREMEALKQQKETQRKEVSSSSDFDATHSNSFLGE